ncbi:hypothetical protein [Noviherbaspirillum aridicola]|uniref:Transmembrane protein n=1 Tax=Noviherbaspirillum aridicola TaxID=2849687 RepID=A0ABQ4Q5R2_9BURK|nr:hypothetical protein [Noviherbaspirillum aridicola]GIZ52546.1 hypothetical protein NCCP691_25600 [Noviherbaspirillum aridicola]
MRALVRHARRAGILVLALGYALLAHYTNIRGTETLGTLVALAPLIFLSVSMAWHAERRGVALTLLGAGFAALGVGWDHVTRLYSTIYWIEHAGTELLLCLGFARTLGPGREPMVTGFARMMHGELSPELAAYTRSVTRAWVWFFGAMATLSTALFLAAPLVVWSAFANFFTAPLIALMFVVEYIVRRRLHPRMRHAHIMDGVKAFWKTQAR